MTADHDPQTVELVARAMHDHACPSDPDAGCSWFEDGPECNPRYEMDGFARAVLDALTAAGWLTTPGVWQMPTAPARPVWTRTGERAEPCPEHFRCWEVTIAGSRLHYDWVGLLTLRGPLSATPPAGTETDDG